MEADGINSLLFPVTWWKKIKFRWQCSLVRRLIMSKISNSKTRLIIMVGQWTQFSLSYYILNKTSAAIISGPYYARRQWPSQVRECANTTLLVDVWRYRDVNLCNLKNSELNGGALSASSPSRLTLLITGQEVVWTQPSARLDAEVETQVCTFRWESNLNSPVTQPVQQARFTYHTDWATPAVTFAKMELVTALVGRYSEAVVQTNTHADTASQQDKHEMHWIVNCTGVLISP